MALQHKNCIYNLIEEDSNSPYLVLTHYLGDEKAVVLDSYVLGYPVLEIDAKAFKGCARIKEIVLPSTLQRIGIFAFAGCVSLKELDLPESVQSVEDYAFYKCTRLSKVTYNSSSIQISESAFRGCPILKK